MTERLAIGLGANLGDPLDSLRGAVAHIAGMPTMSGVAVSSLYRTAPVGGVEQPDFLNAVLVADTDLEPDALIDMAAHVEARFGRTREVRWGPRTLDVDILALGRTVSDDPRIVLPHPRAHERAFVLVPWAEVQPDATIAGHGTVADCLARLSDDDLAGVEPADGPGWVSRP